MVRFPPEPKLVEQLRDAIEPGLYKAMVEGGETYLKVRSINSRTRHRTSKNNHSPYVLMDACCACACVRVVFRTRSE
jgi:hypothetical protein